MQIVFEQIVPTFEVRIGFKTSMLRVILANPETFTYSTTSLSNKING